MSKGKVGILTTNYYNPEGNRLIYGGAERYGLDLTKLLLELGYEVAWWQVGTGWQKEILPGVPLYSIRETGDNYQTCPRLNQSFFEQAVRVDFAIYFVTFLAYPQVLDKSISISHGIFWDYPAFDAVVPTAEQRQERLRRLYIALSGPQKVVSVDTATIQWAVSTWPGLWHKFEFIPNYVDLGSFSPLDTPRDRSDTIRVLFPRRLTSVRGINEAARTAEILTKKYDHLEFHFVGRAHDDKLEKEMISWAEKHPHIYYYWKAPHEMPLIYRNMDIVLIPSKSTEGTSLSCLEAMAAGCAVISSYAGGLSDLIIDGYNGLLCRPTVANLVSAVEELTLNPGLRHSLGQRAQAVATSFSLEKWKASWTRVVSSVFR